MIRMFVAFTALLCLSVVGHADSPTASPLNGQRLNINSLKTWGTRTYSMNRQKNGGDPAGEPSLDRMSFTCEFKDGLVRFTNVTRMYLPDGKRFIEFRGETVHPDSNLFSTKEMHLHASRSDGVTLQKLDVAIDGKKSKIVTEKQGQSSTVEGEWADNTVVDLAMFYLVTLLPHEANRQYRIEYAASSSLRQPKPRILECSGPDPQAAPAEKTWTLFLLYEPNNRADAVRYWVSEDGLLRRVQLNTQNRLDLISDKKDADAKK